MTNEAFRIGRHLRVLVVLRYVLRSFLTVICAIFGRFILTILVWARQFWYNRYMCVRKADFYTGRGTGG